MIIRAVAISFMTTLMAASILVTGAAAINLIALP